MFAGIIFTALSVIGSTAGSLAWYAYSRAVRVSFQGTSVAKSSLLSVGIVDDNHYLSPEKEAEYALTREEHDGHSILFTTKVDGIDYRVIQDYLFNSPYAVNLLLPLTTNARSIYDDGQLYLFESPVHGQTSMTTIADTSHYVKLPLAFKMEDTDGNNMEDVDIWLTSANTQASGENIDQALRLFVENSQRKFLMKPADKGTTTGFTKVGGPLDLDNDGTYDYNLSDHHELYYGQSTGSFVWDSQEYGIPKESAPYDNINEVTNTVESTFYSKHNIEAILPDYSRITPARVEYVPFGQVKPSVVDNQYVVGDTGIVIACTDSTDGVGYVTFTVYIEGWDHVVIDQAANYSFNLSLEFKVNNNF